VDAPATLDRVHSNPDDPFRSLIPYYDIIFTYGGGDPVIAAYEALGARLCYPIYNAADPTTHYPVPPDPRFEGLCGGSSAIACPTSRHALRNSSSSPQSPAQPAFYPGAMHEGQADVA
jgi:spore maturation protein CgeB